MRGFTSERTSPDTGSYAPSEEDADGIRPRSPPHTVVGVQMEENGQDAPRARGPEWSASRTWHCPCGEVNIRMAAACRQCGRPRPDSLESVDPEAVGPRVPSPAREGVPIPSGLPSGNEPALLPDVKGWNWGPLFLGWVWTFAHRLYGWGIVILVLGCIPLLGNIVIAAISIYLAVKGNELAWQRRPFRHLDEFRAVQRIWRNWAIGVAIPTIPILVALALTE